MEEAKRANYMPARWKRPSVGMLLLLAVATGFIVSGLVRADITLDRLTSGASNIVQFTISAFPPDTTRVMPVLYAILETFEMALVGTIIGVIFSVPIAVLSAKKTMPFAVVRSAVRSAVSAMRTIPDLIWALIFVISVGLGPLAGILTIAVDTIGFCARFFSERMEELSDHSKDAMQSTGASYFGVIISAILPASFPSFVGTSLFAVEKAIRSATILGLVGAGGIGVELSTAMSLRKFDEAFMMIILILILVLLVEKVSTMIRAKYI